MCNGGKWGKNAIVAAVALGCALFVMGIVRLDGAQRGGGAGPAPGWKPSAVDELRRPVPAAATPARTSEADRADDGER
jgi:hypothetical protein